MSNWATKAGNAARVRFGFIQRLHADRGGNGEAPDRRCDRSGRESTRRSNPLVSSVNGAPPPEFPLSSRWAGLKRNPTGTERGLRGDSPAGFSDPAGTRWEPRHGTLCDGGISYVEETWRPPRENPGRN